MGGAWAGIAQRLGLTRTVDQNMYMGPNHVAWASCSLDSGLQEGTSQAQAFQETMAEAARLLAWFQKPCSIGTAPLLCLRSRLRGQLERVRSHLLTGKW